MPEEKKGYPRRKGYYCTSQWSDEAKKRGILNIDLRQEKDPNGIMLYRDGHIYVHKNNYVYGLSIRSFPIPNSTDLEIRIGVNDWDCGDKNELCLTDEEMSTFERILMETVSNDYTDIIINSPKSDRHNNMLTYYNSQEVGYGFHEGRFNEMILFVEKLNKEKRKDIPQRYTPKIETIYPTTNKPRRERTIIKIMIMDFDMQDKSDSYFIHTEHTLSMNDYKELQKEVEIFKNLAWNYLIRNVTYEEDALFNLTTDLDKTLYDSRTNPEGCFDLYIDGFLVMVPHMRNIVTILERNSIIPYVFSHSKMIEIIEL